MSRDARNPVFGVSDQVDINRCVQSQKRARSLKFRIYVEEELYYPSSENKGADQLRGYREADLRLCFRLGKNPVFSRCGSTAGHHVSVSPVWHIPFLINIFNALECSQFYFYPVTHHDVYTRISLCVCPR